MKYTQPLIWVLVIVALGVGGYFAYQCYMDSKLLSTNLTQNTSGVSGSGSVDEDSLINNSLPQNDLSNTYTRKDFGFAFEYPKTHNLQVLNEYPDVTGRGNAKLYAYIGSPDFSSGIGDIQNYLGVSYYDVSVSASIQRILSAFSDGINPTITNRSATRQNSHGLMYETFDIDTSLDNYTDRTNYVAVALSDSSSVVFFMDEFTTQELQDLSKKILATATDTIRKTTKEDNNSPKFTEGYVDGSYYRSQNFIVGESGTYEFNSPAHDIDGDVLTYKWYLNGELISTTSTPKLRFTTNSKMMLGERHCDGGNCVIGPENYLRVVVSDSRGGEDVRSWVFVVYNNQQYSAYTPTSTDPVKVGP